MSNISDFFDKKVLASLPASCQVWAVEKFEPITIRETLTASKVKIVRLELFNSRCTIPTSFYKPIDRFFTPISFRYD